VRSACWLLAVLTACYGPAASTGVACGPGDACPSGQECRAGVCVPIGTPFDAAPTDDAAGDAPADATMVTIDAPPDAPPVLGPWGTPTEIEVTIGGETDPSITQDRLTMVLISEDDDDIYIGTRANVTQDFTFTELAAVNSSSGDKSPEISADGLTLYFVSSRGGDYDVYRSTFTTQWSPPVLVPELSTDEDDSDLAISPDGLTAAVVTNTATNIIRIHTRASTAVPFGAGVDHPEMTLGLTDPGAPTITNGGAIVYLHVGSTRDIYMATRKMDGTYNLAVAVPELNTGSRDAAPFVLGDNKYMLFERSSDIYETSR
jgi:hypothetical protein